MPALPPLPPLPALPTLGGTLRPMRRQRKAPIDLSEEEQTSLLEGLGGRLMSMLQYAGESLDKPGAALRGVLSGVTGGDWGGGLANLVPFGETLGITDIPDKVYGRELLTQWGLTPKNEPGFSDWEWDIAGFTAEVLLDPLWLVAGPGRALSKGAIDIASGAGSKAAQVARASKVAVTDLGNFDDAWRAVAKQTGQADDLAKMGVRDAYAGIPGGKKGFVTAEMTKSLLPEFERQFARQIAKEAPVPVLGATAASRAKEMRAGLRGLVQLRWPFGGAEITRPFFTGKRAGDIYEAFHYGRFSPMAPFRAIFSPVSGGIWRPSAQLAKDAAFDELLKMRGAFDNFAPGVSTRMDELRAKAVHMGDEARLAGNPEVIKTYDDLERYIMDARSVTGDKAHLAREDIAKLFDHLADKDLVQEAERFTDGMHEVLTAITGINENVYTRLGELGFDARWLDDRYIEYMTRGIRSPQARQLLRATKDKIMPMKVPFSSARNPVLKNIPEGTLTLNRLSRSIYITGPSGLSKKTHEQVLVGRMLGLGADLPGVTKQGMQQHARLFRQSVDEAAAAWKTKGLAPPKIGYDEIGLRELAADTIVAEPEFAKHVHEVFAGKLAETGFAGVKLGGGLSKLRGSYAWEGFIKPAAIREGVVEGSDEWLRLGEGLKAGHILADEDLITSLPGGFVGKDNVLLKDIPSASDTLADYFRKLPASVRSTGLFDRTVMEDFFDYTHAGLEAQASGMAVHGFLGRFARHSQLDPGAAGIPGLKTVDDTWGMSAADAWDTIPLTDKGFTTFLEEYALKHNPQLAEAVRAARKAQLVDDSSLRQLAGRVDELRHTLRVPEGTDKILNAYVEAMRPANQDAVAGFFRKFTALWKGSVTIPWPAFHTRNLLSGIWQSWAHGDITLRELLESYSEAGRFLYRKQDTLPFLDELKTLDASGHGRMVEIAGETAAREIGSIPERGLRGFVEPFTKGWKRPWEKLPQRQRGAWGGLEEITDIAERRTRMFPVAAAGEVAYEHVEFLNRAAPYIALRKKGLTPAQALHRVRMMQFDYSALSPIEKKYAKVLVPFYTWTRKNLPYQFAKLIAQPGGRTAQTLRAMEATRRESGFAPSFLGRVGAIRIGGPEEEAQFIRMLGLPIEDLAKLQTAAGWPAVGATAQRLLGDIHPMLRFGMEQAAGREFYTGRKLKHLRPLTGVQLVDSMLYGVLPTSRAISTARQILDTRKSLGARAANVLTGFKTGTYDLPKWKLIDLANELEKALEAMPVVAEGRYFYPTAKFKEAATPEELAAVKGDIRLLSGMQKMLAKLAKERREKR